MFKKLNKKLRLLSRIICAIGILCFVAYAGYAVYQSIVGVDYYVVHDGRITMIIPYWIFAIVAVVGAFMWYFLSLVVAGIADILDNTIHIKKLLLNREQEKEREKEREDVVKFVSGEAEVKEEPVNEEPKRPEEQRVELVKKVVKPEDVKVEKPVEQFVEEVVNDVELPVENVQEEVKVEEPVVSSDVLNMVDNDDMEPVLDTEPVTKSVEEPALDEEEVVNLANEIINSTTVKVEEPTVEKPQVVEEVKQSEPKVEVNNSDEDSVVDNLIAAVQKSSNDPVVQETKEVKVEQPKQVENKQPERVSDEDFDNLVAGIMGNNKVNFSKPVQPVEPQPQVKTDLNLDDIINNVSEDVKESVINTENAVEETVEEEKEVLEETVAEVDNSVKEVVNNVVEPVKEVVNEVVEPVQELVEEVVEKVATPSDCRLELSNAFFNILAPYNFGSEIEQFFMDNVNRIIITKDVMKLYTVNPNTQKPVSISLATENIPNVMKSKTNAMEAFRIFRNLRDVQAAEGLFN